MLMKSDVQLGRALWMASGPLSCWSGDYPLCWIQLYLTLCRFRYVRKVYIGCILSTTRWTWWALITQLMISASGWASTVAGRSSSGLKLISQVPSSASGLESGLSRVKSGSSGSQGCEMGHPGFSIKFHCICELLDQAVPLNKSRWPKWDLHCFRHSADSICPSGSVCKGEDQHLHLSGASAGSQGCSLNADHPFLVLCLLLHQTFQYYCISLGSRGAGTPNTLAKKVCATHPLMWGQSLPCDMLLRLCSSPCPLCLQAPLVRPVRQVTHPASDYGDKHKAMAHEYLFCKTPILSWFLFPPICREILKYI